MMTAQDWVDQICTDPTDLNLQGIAADYLSENFSEYEELAAQLRKPFSKQGYNFTGVLADQLKEMVVNFWVRVVLKEQPTNNEAIQNNRSEIILLVSDFYRKGGRKPPFAFKWLSPYKARKQRLYDLEPRPHDFIQGMIRQALRPQSTIAYTIPLALSKSSLRAFSDAVVSRFTTLLTNTVSISESRLSYYPYYYGPSYTAEPPVNGVGLLSAFNPVFGYWLYLLLLRREFRMLDAVELIKLSQRCTFIYFDAVTPIIVEHATKYDTSMKKYRVIYRDGANFRE